MSTSKQIIQEVKELASYLQAHGCEITAEYYEHAYEVIARKNEKEIVVRDGVHTDKINNHPSEDTSFDMFLVDGNWTYALYILEYPLDEYPLRLKELRPIIHAYLAGDYTITTEKFLLWKRRYLNITANGREYHLLGKQNR